MTTRVMIVVALLSTASAVGRTAGGQTLSDLAFLGGCWQGPLARGGVIEEFYTAPSANLIVGTTRYLRDGRTTMFEFSAVTADSTGVTLWPYPRGRRSEDGFRLTSVDSLGATFEAPEHDFPKRIRYIVESADVRVARIDDGTDEGQSMEWRMTRVDCR